MTNLYMIAGTMGVGKTAVCQSLKQKLPNAVFLDGDWCWDANPFWVNDETKNMVMHNICFLLNQFLHCSAYENVIFCWVMHEQSIIDT
ncbi:MAG: AAA family ATPase, partial [Clostridia bacterium]